MAERQRGPRNRPRRPSEGELVVGVVLGPWGIKGDLRVKLLSDVAGRFEPGSVLLLDGEPARIVRTHPHKDGLRVHLDIVPDRNVAELHKGSYLTIEDEEAAPLPEGTYYHHDLMGLEVVDESGESLGRVTEILETGANDVYVVRDDGNEVLLPAVKEVVLKIDLDAGTMTVKPPEVI